MENASHPSRTIVLVHGAWHGAWCWAATQSELDQRGIPSLAIDRPGHGASTLPLTDMHGDAAHVREVLSRIPGEVVLVGHSYGGAVITEAAIDSPNVAHLVYLAAFCLDTGESRRTIPMNLPPVTTPIDSARILHDNETSSIDPAKAIPAFYGSCTPLAAQAAIARLTPQRLDTFTQPVTEGTWRRIPSTYVICEQDGAIHPSHQEFMAARCATTIRLDTDHSPFLSRPRETAEILANCCA